MANPTTNFNWQMPTNTDLVKDLPADFEVFGQAVDTSLMDLKGGTTGQILSKASNTDMDFTWIANDQGDITAVTAGTGISGGGTSGAVTITNSMATAIDAKADLIVGTGSDTFTRLAAGNNGDQLLVDSSTTTGLRWQGNFAAGKNKIINGAFDIWQRGTSFTPANNTVTYTADRFYIFLSGTYSATVSQQSFTAGSAPAAPYEGQFFWRNTISSITGSLSTNRFGQRIEDVRTLANQAVTISFWAKAGANASWTPQLVQDFGSGGSSSVFTSGTAVSVTTSWQRFTQTITLPSISGKTIGTGNNLTFIIDMPVSGAQTNDIWGVQVEAGNVATAFQTATGTLAGELAACQRYYIEYGGDKIFERFGGGSSDALTSGRVITHMPVPMRTTPSMTTTTTDWQLVRPGIAGAAATAITLSSDESSTKIAALTVTIGSTAGFGDSKAVVLCANSSTSARIRLSAEL